MNPRMSGSVARRIEAGADLAAALLLAIAAAYAVAATVNHAVGAVVAGAIAFSACLALLRGGGRHERVYPLARFTPRALELHGLPELVLREDERLVSVGPDSRVVRLFDPAAMPPFGHTGARTDRNPDVGTSPTAPPDASQALYDALADLRRSLT